MEKTVSRIWIVSPFRYFWPGFGFFDLQYNRWTDYLVRTQVMHVKANRLDAHQTLVLGRKGLLMGNQD